MKTSLNGKVDGKIARGQKKQLEDNNDINEVTKLKRRNALSFVGWIAETSELKIKLHSTLPGEMAQDDVDFLGCALTKTTGTSSTQRDRYPKEWPPVGSISDDRWELNCCNMTCRFKLTSC